MVISLKIENFFVSFLHVSLPSDPEKPHTNFFLSFYSRGDRGIMGHGELRTSVIFLKTVSNYCPKTFFFEFSYSSPIFGTPVELRTRILTEL